MIADPDVLMSRIPDQLSVELDGEIAILNLNTKLYFGLTKVGAFIWKLLETPASQAALVRAVCENFEVKTQQTSDDVKRFLVELEDAGLLKFELLEEDSKVG